MVTCFAKPNPTPQLIQWRKPPHIAFREVRATRKPRRRALGHAPAPPSETPSLVGLHAIGVDVRWIAGIVRRIPFQPAGEHDHDPRNDRAVLVGDPGRLHPPAECGRLSCAGSRQVTPEQQVRPEIEGRADRAAFFVAAGSNAAAPAIFARTQNFHDDAR